MEISPVHERNHILRACRSQFFYIVSFRCCFSGNLVNTGLNISDELARLMEEKLLTCRSTGLSSLARMSQDDPDGVLPRRRRERKPRRDPFFKPGGVFRKFRGPP